MMQTILSVIVFLIILVAATLFWDLYNTSKESNLSKNNYQEITLINVFERYTGGIIEESFLDGNLQLVGVEGDGNSDVLVELAIEAIEVPEDLRINV